MSNFTHGGPGAFARLPARWLAKLNLADTPKEVVAVTKEFLATWSARELLRIPQYCRPGRIRDPRQVHELSALLARAHFHFTGKLVDGLVLDRMAVFFDLAAKRLAQMSAIRVAHAAAN